MDLDNVVIAGGRECIRGLNGNGKIQYRLKFFKKPKLNEISGMGQSTETESKLIFARNGGREEREVTV